MESRCTEPWNSLTVMFIWVIIFSELRHSRKKMETLPACQHPPSHRKKIIQVQSFKNRRKWTSWRKHSVKTNLGRHYTLSLRNKVALGTDTILETTLSLVALQPANHTVIPAAGAFGAPGAFLSSRVAGGARLGLQQTPGCGACSWTQHPALSYDIRLWLTFRHRASCI